MITPPVENKTRALARAIWEAGLQLSGPSAALGRILGYLSPSTYEQALIAWRAEISAVANDHDKRLALLEERLIARMEVSSLALDLAFWLCRNSTDGQRQDVEWKVIVAAFENAARRDLEEAVAELEHLGFVETEGALGHTIIHVKILPELLWAFDGAVMGLDTLADARLIADLWLATEETWAIQKLDGRLEWKRRRLNPALAYVRQFIRPKGVSRELQPNYPMLFVNLIGEDRFRLKQFVRSTSGS